MTLKSEIQQKFQVTVAPSGRSFSAGEGQILLAAALEQGINLPYGCQDGACGTCKCKLLRGRVQQGAHQSQALSDVQEAQGWLLTCCASASSDLLLDAPEVTPQGAFPVKKMPVRIKRIERLTADVIRLELQLPTNEVFQFHAGQYINFLLAGGARRSYSMANAAHTLEQGAGLELHIRHQPGGLFTDALFTSLKERDVLRLEGPFGSFHLREESQKPIILLAAGTGFAPIKAILEHMQFKKLARPMTLYWGGRRPADLYLNDWIQAKLLELPNLRYVPVVSDALAQDAWCERTGWVHLAVLQDTAELSGHQVYASGAPVVIEAARRDFLRAGLPATEFYADSFFSLADKVPAVA